MNNELTERLGCMGLLCPGGCKGEIRTVSVWWKTIKSIEDFEHRVSLCEGWIETLRHRENIVQ